MTGQRRSGGWRSETVKAAIVTGAAAVVVAIVGLFGGFGGGGDDEVTPTPEPEPTISIRETTFAAGGAGTITIRVAGATTAFRPGDRLYAIARPPAVKRWWVSDPVVPLIGGQWVALIQASPGDGEQLTVSAVRVPAEGDGGAAPTGEPTVGTAPGTPPTTHTPAEPTETPTTSSPAPPTTRTPSEPPATSATSSSAPPSRDERIEAELRANGENATSVDASSAPVTVVAPSG